MAIPTDQDAHQQIKWLSNEFFGSGEDPLRMVDEISDEDLAKYHICRVPFDFEALADGCIGSELEPPFLFHPLPLTTLQGHPISPEAIGDDDLIAFTMDFRDYDPPRKRDKYGLWNPFDCAQSDHTYLDGYAGGAFPRPGIDLRHLQKLHHIRFPNPFLLGGDLSDGRLPAEKSWRCVTELEYRGDNGVVVSPHIIFTNLLSCNGKEGSILHGELAAIIAAMQNRLYQPAVGEEQVVKNNLFKHPDEVARIPPEFKNEERFPVLQISLFGPQHGRLLYACMDGPQLVIRQSRVYSFEKKATAPWDLFSRFILSGPCDCSESTTEGGLRSKVALRFKVASLEGVRDN